MLRLFVWAFLTACLTGLLSDTTSAVPRSWDGGGTNDNWSTTSNWSPNGNPGGDDLTIGDITPGVFTQTIINNNFNIESLSVVNGAAVDTDGNRLVVSGLVSLTDANTTFRLRETTSGFSGLLAENLFVGTGAEAELHENAELAIGNGAITNFGRIDGSGVIRLLDNPATPTSLFTNSGTLTVGTPGFILPVPERTLQITAIGNNARVDLDGNGSGIVTVGTNSTLDLDVQMLEPFSGTLNLAGGSTLDVEDAWLLDGALNVNNSGFNTVGNNRIVGGLIGLDTGGTISLDEADEVLRFEAKLLAGAGTIANSGTVVFDAPATIAAGADFQMNGNAASLIVNSQVMIDSDFNLDGDGTTSNVVTVNQNGRLTLREISERKMDNVISIDGGHLVFDGTFTEFDGTISLTSTAANQARFDLIVPNDSTNYYYVLGDGVGNDDAVVNVAGAGVSEININNENNLGIRRMWFRSDARTQIASGATLEINGNMYAESGAEFVGEGTLRMGSIVDGFTSPAGGTIDVENVDLDHFVEGGPFFHSMRQPWTINANSIEETDSGFDGDMLISHDINESHMGSLTMNVPGGWRFNSGEITLDQITGSLPTMLSGTRMTIGSAATLVIDGGSIIVDAPLTIEGIVEIPNSNHRLNFIPTEASRIEGGGDHRAWYF